MWGKKPQAKEALQELDAIAKRLVRRDLELSEIRGKREEELKRTQLIIDSLADGLLVFDEERRLESINPQGEETLGIGREDVIGKGIAALKNFPQLRPLVNLLEEETGKIFRKELPLPNGIIIEVTTAAFGEAHRAGRIVALHDITREKNIEQMKTEFVSLAAHQLRTPLSAIKWTLKMLLDGDLGKINKRQKGFIEKTYQSNERMIELINDLLSITRIEEGRYILKTALTDLAELAADSVHSRTQEMKKKKLRLVFQKPKEKLPRVNMDEEKIKLVVDNLIDNAIKYTRPGGTVTISLKSDKKEIGFQIQDTGAGIPEQQKERVFGKFFRGSNVLRMETEGTGLGLFIAKNIVESHGGRISFESEEKKGTTFYFTIPIN